MPLRPFAGRRKNTPAPEAIPDDTLASVNNLEWRLFVLIHRQPAAPSSFFGKEAGNGSDTWDVSAYLLHMSPDGAFWTEIERIIL